MITALIIIAYIYAPKDDKPDLEKTGCLPAILILVDLAILKLIAQAFGLNFSM